FDGIVEVLGLEVGVERVGEQRDLACPLSPLFSGERVRVRGRSLLRRVRLPLTPTLSPQALGLDGDGASVRKARGQAGRGGECIAAPARQLALGGEAGEALGQRRKARDGVAGV